ncbi:MAG TPA: tetratricopeptide repeat protein [Phycisphaerae bacterium]|nr:tetratricopeptide repeat protein [Phycisphaerae bacterium]
MRNTCSHWLSFVMFLTAGAGATAAFAAPPPPKGDPAFFAAEYQGLMALRTAQFKPAIDDFTAAIRRQPDPRVYLARAVAETVSGDYPDAHDDLSHAHIPNSREGTLWQYALWAVAGIAPQGNAAHWGGLPGYIVQGQDDYDTAYASCVAYDFAMNVFDAQHNGGDPHAPALQAAADKAAAWFANRYLASPEMASFSYQSARQHLDKGELQQALVDDNLAKTFFPFDGDIRFVAAEVYRRLGRPESARREYTIALTMDLTSAPAYRGRALAAAAEGDTRRAMTDLAAAAKYDPRPDDPAAKAALALLANDPVIEAPAALLAKLDAAAAGKSVADLLPLALQFQRSHAAFSLRYDEAYQDKLRQLNDAALAAPKNPAPLVAMAKYILEELPNRGESVEPRRGMTPYRYQYSQDMEINRAAFYLNNALKLDPRNVPALVEKAYCLDAAGQADQAESLVEQVTQTAGNNAQAVRLLAEYRAQEAGSLRARALSLRTPTFTSSSHTENRSDGVYEVTTTYRHDPTQAELQEADQDQSRAEAIISQARSLMQQAIKQDPGSLEGLLLQSEYQFYFGTPEAALGLLKKAAAQYPDSLKAHDALITFYLTHGMADEATEARLAENKLYQTTAGPLLERVWANIHPNGWPTVLKDVQRARAIDPADARTSAYLSLAQADARDRDASDATLRVAIALEKARLALDDQGPGAKLPRDAQDFALLMRLLALSMTRHVEAKDMAGALADAREAASYPPRFAPGGMGEQMFGAMLPDANAPEIPVPAPMNGASLAAATYAAAGELLLAQNQRDLALPYFRQAAALGRAPGSNAPRVSNARGDSNFSTDATGPAVAESFLQLAQDALAHRDGRTASADLNAAGDAHPTRDQMTRINNLQLQTAHLMNNPNTR